MASVHISVKPEIWEWVAKQISDIQSSAGIYIKLNEWIDGSVLPTFKQIEELSKKTGIPLGYFFLNTPPREDLGVLEFRTVDSDRIVNPSRELKNTVQDMETVQDWMRNYRQENENDEIWWIGAFEKNDVKVAAHKLREILDIDEDWFKNIKGAKAAFALLRAKLSECGVVVMMNGIFRNNTRKVLNIKEFRAFALVDKVAPLIFINSLDSDTGKIFSLLHETVHLALGSNDLFNAISVEDVYVKEDEFFCNAVTAEILVPQKFLKQYWNLYDKDERIDNLAKVFPCSKLVIARRALDFNLIDKEEYLAVLKNTQNLIAMKKKKSSGGDYYKTMAQRLDGGLVRSLCAKLADGSMSYTEAYRLTNTSGKTFPKIAHDFGGVGFYG